MVKNKDFLRREPLTIWLERLKGVRPQCLFLRDETVEEDGISFANANNGYYCDNCGFNLDSDRVIGGRLYFAHGFFWCRTCIEENETQFLWEQEEDEDGETERS